VLAAVDFDLRFAYVLAGWEGSAHDSVVLRAALKRSNGIPLPEGEHICPNDLRHTLSFDEAIKQSSCVL